MLTINRASVDLNSWQKMVPANWVTEVRLLLISGGSRHGWFRGSDLHLAVDPIRGLDTQCKSASFTINPVAERFLGQCQNRLDIIKEGETATRGVDILEHRRIFIDIDPVEKSQATPPEVIADLEELAEKIPSFGLFRRLWKTRSGNGIHLVCERSDQLPWTSDNLAVLKFHLAEVQKLDWWNQSGKIDLGTPLHPNCTTRVPGTFNRKFEDDPKLVKVTKWYSDPVSPVLETNCQERWRCDLPFGCADTLDSNYPDWYEKVQQQERKPSALIPEQRASLGLDTLDRRIKAAIAYTKATPGGVEGQNGATALYNICCAVVRGFDIPENITLEILMEHYVPRCQDLDDPWTIAEVTRKISEANNTAHSIVRGSLWANAPKRGRPKRVYADPSTMIVSSTPPSADQPEEVAPVQAEQSEQGGEPAVTPPPPPPEVKVEQPKPTKPTGFLAKISNFRVTYSGDNPIAEPVSAVEIEQELLKITGNWPRRVDGELFVAGSSDLNFFSKPVHLFGWLSSRQIMINWGDKKEAGLVGKDEFFESLRKSARVQDYVEVFRFPHQPPISGAYYSEEVEPRKTGRLDDLLELFRPATEADRCLIESMFLTPLWGGRAGRRPIFLIEGGEDNDSGQGTGKTTLAKAVSTIAGGEDFTLTFDKKSVEELKVRLLSDSGRKARVVLIDNAKAGVISSSVIEEIITETNISGKKMYVGNGSRSNFLTFIITSNHPSMSRDIVQRSIPVRVARPKYSARWGDKLNDLITTHRKEIVADILYRLSESHKHQPKEETASRWPDWEAEVLCRCGDPDILSPEIERRKDRLDASEDMRQSVVDKIIEEISKTKGWHSARTIRYWISSNKIVEMVRDLCQHRDLSSISRWLNQLAIPELREGPKRNNKRGRIWTPPGCDPNSPILDYDEDFIPM